MTVTPPDYLHDYDGDWMTYVRDRGGNPEDHVWAVDDPAVLEWERVWMRPVRLSSVDPDERPEGCDEAVTRDKRGRFAPSYLWEGCREGTPGAVAFYGVRYK